jgi:peptidyl-prolyl cis-trans isomerase D
MILEKFRVFGATKAAKGLLFVLILAFGAWGIESFLHAQTSPNGMTINGANISLVELEEHYRSRARQLEQALGSPATPEQLQGLQLAEQILNETLARTVLRQAATELHLQPATRALQAEISALPPFQNEAGQFDTTQYRAALAQMGRTPTQFEREMAADLAVRNFAQLVQLATISPTLSLPQLQLANATTEVAVATLQPAPSTANPTAAQLEDFYKLNPKTYEVPEHRSGQLLELSLQSLSGTIAVPEARIAAEYTANKAAYSTPETRLVRHILLPSLASATDVQKQITTVEDFATKANEVSIDPGNLKTKGGTLGYIKREDVVPGFANMAFGLRAGQISAPVQTPFGWHLVWVEDIRPARVQELAEVRAKIAQGLQEAEVQEALNQLATRADDAIASGSSLNEVAEQLGLKVKPLPRVAANDEATPPAVLSALFATAAGQASPPISLEDGGVAYVATTQIEPAATPPLAKISARVSADWRALQTELATKAAGEALLNAARAPATGNRTLAEAIAQAKVNAQVSTLKFQGVAEAPRWLQPKLLDLMAAKPGTTLAEAVREGDKIHVVQLLKRTPAPAPANLGAAANALTNEAKQDLEALLVSYLQQQATVSCNPQGLQQVFGYAVACPK